MRIFRKLLGLAAVLIFPAHAALAGGISGGIINHANEPAATTPQSAVQKICSGCHDLKIVTDTPKDYDAWHVTVQDMIDRGAVGTPDEFDLVMDYLYRNFTTVDVNHADADDLKVILNASDAAARAIITRRQTKPFASLTDLETIHGLDIPTLEAKKRMIFFN